VRSTQLIRTILDKMDKNAAELSYFPHITQNGKWITTLDDNWTSGFWIGLLWLSYKLTDEKRYTESAYNWLRLLEKRKTERTPDLGFLFYPSFALGHQITNDDYLKKTALEAADTLTTLFNEKVNLIYNEKSMDAEKFGQTAVDLMMNLQLLWWAYEETKEEKYYQIAFRHSKSTIENLIREDWSTIHVINFDLESGDTISKKTVQGYSDDSCWSRGQAWAIYGYALAYGATMESSFLEIGEKVADYFIRNLPRDYVPFWDFNDPKIPNTVRDSSAAAIACSGMLTLSQVSKKEKFRETALRILNSLSKNYLAGEGDGLLKHGCYDKPEKVGVDESLIWGDYYFVEALEKVRGKMDATL